MSTFTYTGETAREVSFPLGGIGTGCIGLSGTGRLIDWEIFNRPQKNGSTNGFSFFAIKVEDQTSVLSTNVITGDLEPPYIGNGHVDWTYGFGVQREYLSGLPHFRHAEFEGRFPIANMTFKDDEVPVDVDLEAFNPLIPLNEYDSSLPCAILSYTVRNRTSRELTVSVGASVSNPFERGGVNRMVKERDFAGIILANADLDPDDARNGEIVISTNLPETNCQLYWYRGAWFDNLTVFWREFSAHGRLPERDYQSPIDTVSWNATVNFRDVATLCGHQCIPPGEERVFPFVISWNFPNFQNYWDDARDDEGRQFQWKNHYATRFGNAADVASYVWPRLPSLRSETMRFRDTLFASTFPPYVLDAVSANIATLKSPTCIRLSNGTLYGFEGCNYESGCCEGSCTHVWNYAQATAFLFPSLERSMRAIDYSANQLESGKMFYRMLLPPERNAHDRKDDALGEDSRVAADGQLGGIIKTYRDWRISGDTEWLRAIWHRVKAALEYAWSPQNEYAWDVDRDGVMEGIQHHTLDVRIYGPNSYITSYYLCALRAASEMADALDDPDGAKYLELYERGARWVNDNLFNGEYFHQKIDLTDARYPVDPQLGEVKYQIGDGCHIDQVVGQWHAHVSGLGHILERSKVRSALSSVYRYNFRSSMRGLANTYRVFALNEERGVVMCTWPRGQGPKIPVPYSSECMSGFEYQLASHMIYEGLVDEGLEIVQAVRERFDGRRRNPWSEIECGSNYARAMASYAVLLALSGFEYDMVKSHIGFNPKIHQDDFRVFWCIEPAWGLFELNADECVLSVLYGEIVLASFTCGVSPASAVSEVTVDGAAVPFVSSRGIVTFERPTRLAEGARLAVGFTDRPDGEPT